MYDKQFYQCMKFFVVLLVLCIPSTKEKVRAIKNENKKEVALKKLYIYYDKNSLEVERYTKENVNSTFHCPFRQKNSSRKDSLIYALTYSKEETLTKNGCSFWLT